MYNCYLSCRIRKGENKGADQLCSVTAQLISSFVFATGIEQFLFFLNPKFRASNYFLQFDSLVCVIHGLEPKFLVTSSEGAPFALFFSDSR